MNHLETLLGKISTLLAAHHQPWALVGGLAVKALSNDNAVWDGTCFGLQPQLSTLAQRVLGQGEKAAPFLRAAVMRDIDR
jgi:hypothetical protein